MKHLLMDYADALRDELRRMQYVGRHLTVESYGPGLAEHQTEPKFCDAQKEMWDADQRADEATAAAVVGGMSHSTNVYVHPAGY